MRPSRAAAGAAVVLFTLISGCTGPEPVPVPRTADAPWLCSGVPLESIELALGGAELDDGGGQGALGWRDEQFTCSAEADESSIIVSQEPVLSSPFGSTEDDVVATLQESSAAQRIDADAPGRGYLTRVDDPVAVWVCTDFVTRVSFTGTEPDGRTWSEDAVNLLVSMLPWACGEEPPPPTD